MGKNGGIVMKNFVWCGVVGMWVLFCLGCVVMWYCLRIILLFCGCGSYLFNFVLILQ